MRNERIEGTQPDDGAGDGYASRRGPRPGDYRPQPIRRTYIPKPGSEEMRPLGVPTVRDRVVQGALRHVLEPIFEQGLRSTDTGFGPGEAARTP